MAYVKLAEIMNDHSWDLRDSLGKAVRDVVGRDVPFDDRDLYEAFEAAVRWRFRTWVPVEDEHVQPMMPSKSSAGGA